MSFLPAASILAVLEGFSALKLDVARIRRDASIADLTDPDALVPAALFEEVVRAARVQAPREELVLEAALSMPLGAFGLMDYLAASSDTVGEAFTSLQRFLPTVAPGCVFEIEESAREYAVVLRRNRDYEKGVDGDELTLGVTLRHFRTYAESFPVRAVDSSRRDPAAPEAFRRLFGAPVRFGLGSAALRLAPEAPGIALKSRDPLLRRTLEVAAARLGLGDAAPPLEMVIRGRLRELLPEGKAEASHVAEALALSTRSLHRKLAEVGRTFHDVVSEFRRAEAERLLSQGRASLSEVALRLGFADQSAFSRAFKRWTELSPSEWRSAHAPLASSKHPKLRPEEPT
jgi:AraC-like DNA-binding protein